MFGFSSSLNSHLSVSWDWHFLHTDHITSLAGDLEYNTTYLSCDKKSWYLLRWILILFLQLWMSSMLTTWEQGALSDLQYDPNQAENCFNFLLKMTLNCCFSNFRLGSLIFFLLLVLPRNSVCGSKGECRVTMGDLCHPALPAHVELPPSRLKWNWLSFARRENENRQSKSGKIWD